MDTHTKELKAVFGYRSFNIFNDKVTKNKINRHLNDINDTITEEDIRNIMVTIPSDYNFNSTNQKVDSKLNTWDILNP